MELQHGDRNHSERDMLELSDEALETVSGGCDCRAGTTPVIISKPGGGYKIVCVPQS